MEAMASSVLNNRTQLADNGLDLPWYFSAMDVLLNSSTTYQGSKTYLVKGAVFNQTYEDPQFNLTFNSDYGLW